MNNTKNILESGENLSMETLLIVLRFLWKDRVHCILPELFNDLIEDNLSGKDNNLIRNIVEA